VRRQLVLLILIGIAPVVASYALYYLWPRDRQVNYGTLIAAPAPAIEGRTLDGRSFALADLRGKWVVLTAADGGCDAACATRLFAGRPARTIQNAERDRIVRVWLVTGDATPSPALLAEHDDLRVVRVSGRHVDALPRLPREVLLVDPLGNVVLAWPADPDVKAMARDLGRLLRASRIG
jgi:cytochrome oxidase Cu insertion factor (SCO1/SenC/PrrC family)